MKLLSLTVFSAVLAAFVPPVSAQTMAEAYAGSVLVSVETPVRAWYVSPTRKIRVSVDSATELAALISTEALGVTTDDLNGIPMAYVVGVIGPDTDSDGLLNTDEIAMGTDPHRVDTDSDGYWDDLELRNSYSPRGAQKMAVNHDVYMRLRGRIVMAVQQHGEVWYVSPLEPKRYYVGDTQGIEKMKQLGLRVQMNMLIGIPTASAAGSSSVGQPQGLPLQQQAPIGSRFQSSLIPFGKSVFTYEQATVNANKPIRVFTYVPSAATVDSPILFVMHGVNRNAEAYRDDWIAQADRFNVILFAPEFRSQYFPSTAYAQGNILSGKRVRSVDQWTVGVPDRMFAYVAGLTNTRQTQYDIYGHSAGAQFVHRMLMLKPDNKVRRAVVANAGWYTMPSTVESYPYGMGGLTATNINFLDALRKDVTVLLGEQDTNVNDPELRKTAQARAQGEHRLARGRTFYATTERIARDAQRPFVWRLQTVPGAGHSNAQMVPAAASALYAR